MTADTAQHVGKWPQTPQQPFIISSNNYSLKSLTVSIYGHHYTSLAASHVSISVRDTQDMFYSFISHFFTFYRKHLLFLQIFLIQRTGRQGPGFPAYTARFWGPHELHCAPNVHVWLFQSVLGCLPGHSDVHIYKIYVRAHPQQP